MDVKTAKTLAIGTLVHVVVGGIGIAFGVILTCSAIRGQYLVRVDNGQGMVQEISANSCDVRPI